MTSFVNDHYELQILMFTRKEVEKSCNAAIESRRKLATGDFLEPKSNVARSLNVSTASMKSTIVRLIKCDEILFYNDSNPNNKLKIGNLLLQVKYFSYLN